MRFAWIILGFYCWFKLRRTIMPRKYIWSLAVLALLIPTTVEAGQQFIVNAVFPAWRIGLTNGTVTYKNLETVNISFDDINKQYMTLGQEGSATGTVIKGDLTTYSVTITWDKFGKITYHTDQSDQYQNGSYYYLPVNASLVTSYLQQTAYSGGPQTSLSIPIILDSGNVGSFTVKNVTISWNGLNTVVVTTTQPSTQPSQNGDAMRDNLKDLMEQTRDNKTMPSLIAAPSADITNSLSNGEIPWGVAADWASSLSGSIGGQSTSGTVAANFSPASVSDNIYHGYYNGWKWLPDAAQTAIRAIGTAIFGLFWINTTLPQIMWAFGARNPERFVIPIFGWFSDGSQEEEDEAEEDTTRDEDSHD